MSQINVNTPGEPSGSGGMGMIVGVILAVVVIGAIVYFLVLNGGGSGGGTENPDGGGDVVESLAPEPSAWRLVDLA